jgi:hypothetical protein
MAVLMKNAVFWDVTPCGSCKIEVSEKCVAFIIRVERISVLGTLAVTNRSRFQQNPHGATSKKTAFLKNIFD